MLTQKLHRFCNYAYLRSLLQHPVRCRVRILVVGIIKKNCPKQQSYSVLIFHVVITGVTTMSLRLGCVGYVIFQACASDVASFDIPLNILCTCKLYTKPYYHYAHTSRTVITHT